MAPRSQGPAVAWMGVHETFRRTLHARHGLAAPPIALKRSFQRRSSGRNQRKRHGNIRREPCLLQLQRIDSGSPYAGAPTAPVTSGITRILVSRNLGARDHLSFFSVLKTDFSHLPQAMARGYCILFQSHQHSFITGHEIETIGLVKGSNRIFKNVVDVFARLNRAQKCA